MRKKLIEPKISRRDARGQKTKSPGYEANNHWNICDLCGCAVRNKDSRLTWDGKVVCPDDWDYRHPQDFVRGRADDQSPVGLVRPEGSGEFVLRNPITLYTPPVLTITRVLNTTQNLVGVLASAGGESVTVSGLGFVEDMTLSLGEFSDIEFTYVDENTITFTSPTFVAGGLFALILELPEGEQAFYQITVLVPDAPPPFARQTYDEVVASFDPIIYYKFDELAGTVAADSSGNGYDAEYINSPTLGVDKLVYDTDGTSVTVQSSGSRRVKRADTVGLPTDGDITVVGWFLLNASTGVEAEMVAYTQNGSGSVFNAQWGIFLSTSSRVIYGHEYATNTPQRATFLWDHITPNQPYMVAFSRNSTTKTVNMYINGVHVRQYSYIQNPDGGSSAILKIGHNMNGTVDCVSIYGEALSGDDILQHFIAASSLGPVPDNFTPVRALRFDTSGSLTLNEASNVRVIAVGGGGAGGTFGGGGGGGGSVADVSFYAAPGEYIVEVGSGAPASGTSSVGADGDDTTFGDFITAAGGEGGNRGSGGLEGGDSPPPKVRNYELYSLRQGADVGSGSSSGAGAGAGEGFTGSSLTGGDGVDLTTLPAFASFYGGGGGGATSSSGGAGGAGGGGTGSLSSPTAGTDGLGGGGGGRWNSGGHSGTAGGDGVVLVFLETTNYTTTGFVTEESL